MKIYEYKGLKLVETGDFREPKTNEYFISLLGQPLNRFYEGYSLGFSAENGYKRKILKPYYGEPLPPPSNPCEDKEESLIPEWMKEEIMRTIRIYPMAHTLTLPSNTLDKLRVMSAIEKIEEIIKAEQYAKSTLKIQGYLGLATNYRCRIAAFEESLTILKGVLE
jgi:hypothetical protein